MSVLEVPQEAKEDLLGLDDGWKNWLRPPEHPNTRGEDAAPPEVSGSTELHVKDELKEEKDVVVSNSRDPKGVIVIEDGNKEEQEEEDANKEEIEEEAKDEDVESVKEEGSKIQDDKSDKDDDTTECLKYKMVTIKNYSENCTKEEPVDDLHDIFTESTVKFEKQKYHQQIFNEILEDMDRKKFEELQMEYIDYLRRAIELTTYTCSKCEYQTIHKSNLKTHLFLIHKKDMETKMFQCIADSCKYKSKSLGSLKKHQEKHEEEESDFEPGFIDDDDWDIDIKPKRAQKRRRGASKDAPKRRPLLCDFCQFEGENRESLRIHLQTHKCPENPNRFLCYICDYGVNHRTSLQKHLYKMHHVVTKGVHKFKERKCEFCDYTTDSKECFDIHMMQHQKPEEIKWLNCTYCEFKTKHKAALRYHLKNHKLPEEQLRKYMCEVCSKKFKTKGGLDMHSLRHKSMDEVTKIYNCSQCKFQTKLKTSLTAHMEVHRDPTYVCDICGLRSRRKYNHDMHVLTHKSENEVETFKCAVCAYTTKFRASLKKHIAKGLHSGPVKRTPSKRPRIKHPDGTVEIDTTCDVCGVKLSSYGALTTHMRIHKNPDELEMFKCDECPFESKFKGNLVSHQRKHKPHQFKCEVCGLQLRTKWNYNMHLLTHKSSSECELFNCCVCSYQTKFKPYLREHLKKRHNILTAQRPGPKPRKKRNTEG